MLEKLMAGWKSCLQNSSIWLCKGRTVLTLKSEMYVLSYPTCQMVQVLGFQMIQVLRGCVDVRESYWLCENISRLLLETSKAEGTSKITTSPCVSRPVLGAPGYVGASNSIAGWGQQGQCEDI